MKMARIVRSKSTCKHATIFMLYKRQGAQANAVFCSVSYKCNFCMGTPMHNKKSAESDVAPAGIKSYKFLFVLKTIYFALFKKLIG